jgi:polysaccharide export outer membrane protein
VNPNLRIALLVSLLLMASGIAPCAAQTKEEAKQQAEAQLKQMTPDEIERKIRELGLTREEAIRKADELGISLERYLSVVKPAPPPLQTAITTKEAPLDTSRIDTTAKPGPANIPLSPSGLPYFGYDIFTTPSAAFEPAAAGPVDPEYVIGPGDVLRVSVWGQVEFQNELTVDREGRIFVTTVGQVLVGGLTLDQAYNKLLRTMSRSYAGLVAKTPTVWLDVTIARLRPKRVFLMGEVFKPGGYTVSSYATVFNSLYGIGGPTVKGSLREVRLIRGDRVVAKIDLYDYLRGAEKTNDLRVQNNDIIFVPIRGRTVSVRGAVQRPAVYELKDGEELGSLLEICGGLLSTAYAPTAQIDRIKPLEKRTGSVEDRVVVDVDLRNVLMKGGRDVPLFNGDELQVFPILDEKYNFVTITGSVWRPGRYEIREASTLRDLVVSAKGLQPKTYMELAHIIRYNADLLTTRIIPLDLRKVMEDEKYNRILLPRDEVIVYSTEITEVKNRFVTISGEVKKPGQYPLRTNMTLEDLIPLAGGYTEAAEGLISEVSRVGQKGLTGDSLAIVLYPSLPPKFLPPSTTVADSIPASELIAQGRFILQHRDEVLVRPNPNYKTQRDVSVGGDFTYPGTYTIQRRGERISELLHRAGGPTPTTYLDGAEYYRGGKRLLIDLRKAFYDNDKKHDIELFAGDRIVIPSRPHTVFVAGEVNKPGLLSFVEGNSVSDYIDRAGGLTDSASYAVLSQPTGESRRVNFGFLRSDPDVQEGASIEVKKMPAPPPVEKGESVSTTIKDIFAVVTSAATIAFLIWQVTK